jgi:hypothetical protein
MKMAFVKLALATSAGMVALAACGSENDGYDPGVATSVIYISGSGQSGDAGGALGELLTIETTNFVGDPVGGVSVEWFVVNGGGSLSKGVTTTDANGLSQVTWFLGPTVGPQRAQAVTSLSGSPITFNATARAPSDENDGNDGGGDQPAARASRVIR